MIALLLGTRPEIIKMSPIIRELMKRKQRFIFVHSGQHYSPELDSIFFEELHLPKPDFQLNCGSGSHAQQTAAIMVAFEKVCVEQSVTTVLVHGDTNTTLAGGIVAKKLNLKLGHVEAGLRSYDMSMPEEVNRRLVDSVADFLYAPTVKNQENLLQEGVHPSKIVLTGNTVVDAVHQNIKLATKNVSKLEKGCILVTAHRPANVDDTANLRKLIKLVEKISAKVGKPSIWPVHPRTEKILKESQLKLPDSITIIPPVGYLSMLNHMLNASYILTDSGGIQEEAYILKKPVLTLRNNTERPETLSANVLVGLNVKAALQALNFFESGQAVWGNELGTGVAAEKIVTHLLAQDQKL
jgi:UDP-N-acetylglucosamine 2-epimerase (non-hydrolysing)